jgi:hypothetical protein
VGGCFTALITWGELIAWKSLDDLWEDYGIDLPGGDDEAPIRDIPAAIAADFCAVPNAAVPPFENWLARFAGAALEFNEWTQQQPGSRGYFIIRASGLIPPGLMPTATVVPNIIDRAAFRCWRAE